MAASPALAFHRMHPCEHLRARVLGDGGVQHGCEGLGPAPPAGDGPVTADLVDHDHRGTVGEHRVILGQVGRAIVLAEAGLAHERYEPAGVSKLLVRDRPVLDQPLQLTGGRGVVVHPHRVRGEAQRGILAPAEPGGAEEAVLQGEVGHAEPGCFGLGRPFHAPAGEAVDPSGRRDAGRQELEPVSAQKEALQPPRLQGDADGTHAKPHRALETGGRGVGRGAGSAKHVCYPDQGAPGISPEHRCSRFEQTCHHWAFRPECARRGTSAGGPSAWRSPGPG